MCIRDRFDRAIAYEDKVTFEDTAMQGRKYTWSGSETLRELLARREDILEKHKAAVNREREARGQRPLIDVLADVLDDEDDQLGCMVCHL